MGFCLLSCLYFLYLLYQVSVEHICPDECRKQALVFVIHYTFDQISFSSIMQFGERSSSGTHEPLHRKGPGTKNASNSCRLSSHTLFSSDATTEASVLSAASIFTPFCTSSASGCEMRQNLLQIVWSHRTAHDRAFQLHL